MNKSFNTTEQRFHSSQSKSSFKKLSTKIMVEAAKDLHSKFDSPLTTFGLSKSDNHNRISSNSSKKSVTKMAWGTLMIAAPIKLMTAIRTLTSRWNRRNQQNCNTSLAMRGTRRQFWEAHNSTANVST